MTSDIDNSLLLQRINEMEQNLLDAINSSRPQASADGLRCPYETRETYKERRKGDVQGPEGMVICPGGFPLELSRVKPDPDAAKAADSFFHSMPPGTQFRAQYPAIGSSSTMTHHNVWRSDAVTFEVAQAQNLPGARVAAAPPQVETPANGTSHGAREHAPSSNGAQEPTPMANGAPNGSQDPTPLFSGEAPPAAAPAELRSAPSAASMSDAITTLIAWARGRYGSALTAQAIMRAAGPGDWRQIAARHNNDWNEVARAIDTNLKVSV